MVSIGNHAAFAPANPDSIISGDKYRITLLTSRLARFEWSETGEFTDRPTPLVVNRNFPAPTHEVIERDGVLEIRTDHLLIRYSKTEFSSASLSVTLRQRAQGSHRTTWKYGEEIPEHPMFPGNLKGTARTLDEVDGACELEDGILATYGFAAIDDSQSVLLGENDWVAARPNVGKDLYFFGYGRDFQAALSDLFKLTGPVPLVPRQALGNWWSRYWRYSEQEYLQLMAQFEEKGVPFSVSVIDMDWHLVDIDPKLGSGWTGYTWNKELFPDPRRFLSALHDQGKLVTLNVHPADGVRSHEEAYPQMARDLGIDPESGREIPFDITSPEFVDSYFKRLHHPLEDEGVDFWWLDWQSGGSSNISGLDPLWMLNHLHFEDSSRGGKRPLTFSRYSGIGSHRYPVGFSGDTITTWESLDFQPYFTATAANVGYYWWSHDIGGHMMGYKDDELAARWFQFGALSPINRLHSSSDPFNSKEPSRFSADAERTMVQFLRLRHLLVPYLYTAAWDAHVDGVGVVRPMYHDYPNEDAAYRVPNQYLLGRDLIVAPITTKMDRSTGLAHVEVWLPEGTWFDVLTGARYEGGRTLPMHRSMDRIPVLQRAGSVVPMLADPMASIAQNPSSLVLRTTLGTGDSVLFEDDGSGAPTLDQRTELRIRVEFEPATGDLCVTADPILGTNALAEREVSIELAGVDSFESATLNSSSLPDAAITADASAQGLAPATLILLGTLDLTKGFELRIAKVSSAEDKAIKGAFSLLDAAQIEYAKKSAAMTAIESLRGVDVALALEALSLPSSLRLALLELRS